MNSMQEALADALEHPHPLEDLHRRPPLRQPKRSHQVARAGTAFWLGVLGSVGAILLMGAYKVVKTRLV